MLPYFFSFQHGEKLKGLTVVTAAIFIVGDMAGSGVLALPRAVVDSGKSMGYFT